MPYHLNTDVINKDPRITIIGCGGTGGFVAEAVCRLFTGRAASIVLVDHDRVERHNLLRQNFHPEDIGGFKSQALAERLARDYRRPIGYSTHPFQGYTADFSGVTYPGLEFGQTTLMIGCVDNAAARREMNDFLSDSPDTWLIDAGNDRNWGQVLIGNCNDPDHLTNDNFVDDRCNCLPSPALQRPDLLTAVSNIPADVDCAAALDLIDQDPTINAMMASLVVQVVRRMAVGTCPFMSLYLDMDQGTVSPTHATPEAVSRIVNAITRP